MFYGHFFETQLELHPNAEQDRYVGPYSKGLNFAATVSQAVH